MSIDIGETVERLGRSLEALQAGEITPDVVCARFRLASLQWPDLPPRYDAVLERLLQPLDTAAMLGEESCSFSRTEVVQALRQWLEHAAALNRHHV
ncbi:hypothetical protein [Ideonella livida]|uniref:Uncharacterized protein n=1 Tax=Ideonella livida TaxID=2707176 RepID=A0A7C9PGD8_9BURK|nr:hypothetical protein [Ideonella livida]NDY90989.1 hypothetical protein [Ideonella livida]